MPVYEYQCLSWKCANRFEAILSIAKCDEPQICQECGSNSNKVPSMFSSSIFQKRIFADGTTTPDFVRTPKQEASWLRSEGMSYDNYSRPNDVKISLENERKKQSAKDMDKAFLDAYKKVDQGFVLHDKPEDARKESKLNFSVEEGR